MPVLIPLEPYVPSYLVQELLGSQYGDMWPGGYLLEDSSGLIILESP